jgi:hypothetical protein
MVRENGHKSAPASGTTVVVCTLLLVLFYLAAPGICVAAHGDVPERLEWSLKPLEWFYKNCKTYKIFIDTCEWR